MVTSQKQPAVYVLASKRNGTLYIGVTSDIRTRVWQHKNDVVEGFTKKYGVHSLVYYELHEDMVSAIRREKQMKSEPWLEAELNRTTWTGGICGKRSFEEKCLDSRFRGNDGLFYRDTMTS